jgi:hypothetical protein
MNYLAIAGHLEGRGHAISVEAIGGELAPGRLTPTCAQRLDRGAAQTAISPAGASASPRRTRSRCGIPTELQCARQPSTSRIGTRYGHPAGEVAGLVAGVVSNSMVARAPRRRGARDALDFVIDSAVVGVEKPDPRIFHLAIERADVAASEAVYVGDLYSVDVLGSRAAGLGAILLDPRGFWGPRDCDTARDLLEATGLILGTAGGTIRKEQS